MSYFVYVIMERFLNDCQKKSRDSFDFGLLWFLIGSIKRSRNHSANKKQSKLIFVPVQLASQIDG